jgi:hypothetical protein
MKKKEEQPAEEKKRTWVDCGYVTISKSGKVLSVVVKNQRYVVNLEEAAEVLDGKRNYTLVFEHVNPSRDCSERNKEE